MKTYVQYPPCKPQSESYTGPITLSDNGRFQFVRDALKKEGINTPLKRVKTKQQLSGINPRRSLELS
jgi:hypothetical protein